MKNFIIKTLFALSSLISIALTVQYMYSLAGAVTISAVVFIATGLLFEGCKLVFPCFAVEMKKAGKLANCAALSLIWFALAFVSFAASVSALENGNAKAVMNSNSYKQTEQQIKALENIQTSQLSANQITKAAQTTEHISQLRDQLKTMKPESVSAAISKEISIGVSLIIEILSVSLSVMLPRNSEISRAVSVEVVEETDLSISISSDHHGNGITHEIAKKIEDNFHRLPEKLTYKSVSDVCEMPNNGSNLNGAFHLLAKKQMVIKKGRSWFKNEYAMVPECG